MFYFVRTSIQSWSRVIELVFTWTFIYIPHPLTVAYTLYSTVASLAGNRSPVSETKKLRQRGWKLSFYTQNSIGTYFITLSKAHRKLSFYAQNGIDPYFITLSKAYRKLSFYTQNRIGPYFIMLSKACRKLSFYTQNSIDPYFIMLSKAHWP